MRNDLLAYMRVLNDSGVNAKLAGIDMGNADIMGCLMRLQDKLSALSGNGQFELTPQLINGQWQIGLPDESESRLLEVIKRRERINGRLPVGATQLVDATRECAEACLAYYRKLCS